MKKVLIAIHMKLVDSFCFLFGPSAPLCSYSERKYFLGPFAHWSFEDAYVIHCIRLVTCNLLQGVISGQPPSSSITTDTDRSSMRPSIQHNFVLICDPKIQKVLNVMPATHASFVNHNQQISHFWCKIGSLISFFLKWVVGFLHKCIICVIHLHPKFFTSNARRETH